jgi:hypothetical protein
MPYEAGFSMLKILYLLRRCTRMYGIERTRRNIYRWPKSPGPAKTDTQTS